MKKSYLFQAMFLSSAAALAGCGGETTEVLNSNTAPLAIITADTTNVDIKNSLTFDGSESLDTDGEVVSYYWDGVKSDKASFTKPFNEAGNKVVTLIVEDAQGKKSTPFVFKVTVIDPDEGSTIDTGANTDTGTGTGTDSDSDTGTGTGTDTNTGTGTGTDTDTDTDTGTGTGTDTGTGTGTGTGTDTGTGTGTGTDTGTGTGTGTGTDTDTGTGTGTDTGTDTGTTDTTAPQITASVPSGKYTSTQSITLTASDDTDDAADIAIYYTLDGSEPSTRSPKYTGQQIDATDIKDTGADLTVKTLTVDTSGNEKLDTFSYTIGEAAPVGEHYSTNPNGQVGKFSSNMAVNCDTVTKDPLHTNSIYETDSVDDWSEDMLIAQGAAYDDAKSFKGNWEYPNYDIYSLYASWDDNNLYIGWQYVYVNDIAPGQNGGIEARPFKDSIPQMLVFDLDPNKASVGGEASGDDLWAAGTYKRFDLSMGLDAVAMFSSSCNVGEAALFFVNDNNVFENTETSSTDHVRPFYVRNGAGEIDANASVVYGTKNTFVPSSLWGVLPSGEYTPSMLSENAGWVDYLSLGHQSETTGSDYYQRGQDFFYEMKIPFSHLGITREYLESQGIGVMLISTFGQSAVDSVPHDMTTLDNVMDDYSKDSGDGHTSAEKEDLDNFTSSMARIGKL